MWFCCICDTLIYQYSLFYTPNSNPIRVKERLYCMTREAILECKSGSIAAQRCLFCSVIHCTLTFLNSITSCMSVHYRCTLKTQEFRTKDFLVRWTRSIERQECKYSLRRNRRRIRNFEFWVILGFACAPYICVNCNPWETPAHPTPHVFMSNNHGFLAVRGCGATARRHSLLCLYWLLERNHYPIITTKY